ncbi:hypothetical protein [Fusobacterium sp. PH5-44]|uniref:hypothetical protein n=1 Tax=unclassified Fusobacterium TaxID=2648384 RepID=UPI003D1B9678
MRQTDIYEKSGKNQESDHHLGAIQSVIRGRIRFIPIGLSFIAIALFGLYIFYFTDKKFFIDRTPINTVIITILFIGAILYGLQFVNYAFYRIKLRHTGFEISSMLGTKSYEYKDVDFYLNKTIEHKHNSDGYRPVFGKVGNFNYIWICQIIFKDTRKPIILKSSRYARLRDKISELIEALNGKNV